MSDEDGGRAEAIAIYEERVRGLKVLYQKFAKMKAEERAAFLPFTVGQFIVVGSGLSVRISDIATVVTQPGGVPEFCATHMSLDEGRYIVELTTHNSQQLHMTFPPCMASEVVDRIFRILDGETFTCLTLSDQGRQWDKGIDLGTHWTEQLDGAPVTIHATSERKH